MKKEDLDSITDGNIRRGLTFAYRKSKVYEIRNFSPTAFRRAYIKALFFEDERWIRKIESQDKGRIMWSIVECKEKNRTEKNLELQAELKDQIWSNLEIRKGYYEAWRNEKPTTKFAKHLHPDVRRFIHKCYRYKNKTEGMADYACEFYVEEPKLVPLEKQISEDGIVYYVVFDFVVDKKQETYTAGKEIEDGNREIFDRGVFDGAVRHEGRANRRVKKPTTPTVHKALTKEKALLRKRPHTMVTRKPDQRFEISG